MALFAEQVPEYDREILVAVIVEVDGLGAGHQLVMEFVFVAPRRGEAGQVALHIGHEHRHARLRKPLGEDLQRDGLAGARRSGDQPMAVAEAQQQALAHRRSRGRRRR